MNSVVPLLPFVAMEICCGSDTLKNRTR